MAWLAGYRGNTREAYGRDLRDFAMWCEAAALQLLAVTRAHAELYARDLQEGRGLAAGTVARRLAALASFYGWLLDEEIIAKTPMARVRRPRVSRESATMAPDRDELARLLTVAKASSDRDHALVCLLALNGLRISEAVGIDVDDLSSDRGHRVVRIMGKGNKEAIVPLAPRTAAAVDSLVELRSESIEPLFIGARGRRMSRHAAHAMVKRLAARAGIQKRLSPHSLRHAHVQLALEAGVPIREVQLSVRHASIATTQRYMDRMLALDRHATYRLASFMEPADR